MDQTDWNVSADKWEIEAAQARARDDEAPARIADRRAQRCRIAARYPEGAALVPLHIGDEERVYRLDVDTSGGSVAVKVQLVSAVDAAGHPVDGRLCSDDEADMVIERVAA